MAAVLRAMGVESDQEILALVGSEPALATLLAPTLQEAKSMGLFIRQQALEYLGICHQFLCILFTQCQPVSILQRVNCVALLAWRHGASVGESQVLVRCAREPDQGREAAVQQQAQPLQGGRGTRHPGQCGGLPHPCPPV